MYYHNKQINENKLLIITFNHILSRELATIVAMNGPNICHMPHLERI